MYTKCFCILAFWMLAQLGRTQSLVGDWSGTVTQTGKAGVFNYTLSLQQENNKVYGTATSSNADGSGAAKFEVGGSFDGQQLVLQEVRQLEPENAKWCLKHIRLKYAERQGELVLEGNWEAEGCKPGTIALSKKATTVSGQSPEPEISAPLSKMALGRYAGNLSQSDREYGFYVEMEFQADGTGIAHIVSDGEGGNATHRFNWTFDEDQQELSFEETEILEESVPSWRWCMKSGKLLFQKEKNRRSLTGNWQGYIEGTNPVTGACAPGKLYVEQPILYQNDLAQKSGEPTVQQPDPVEVKAYEAKTKREVDVERVLEVRNKTVRIRVWDNGSVDGDVLSLFLNGDLIIKNYRVTRQKYEAIVKLDKPTNFIILHALNLGSISPNTVAVSVDDGFQEQVVIISSNLDKSGAVMIKEFTVK